MERESKPPWGTACGCKTCHCPTPLHDGNAVLMPVPDDHEHFKAYWVCAHCAHGEHHSGEDLK